MAKQNADVNGERRTLWIVLLLNSAIAAAFLVTGAIGDSSALIANGLDNLSDAAVYALSLVALTRGMKRSEEHTYELQSLMRISYDVFCLKKKTNKPHVIP